MKLTEQRLKQIIREEIENAQEPEKNSQEESEDEAKTKAALRTFMIEKGKAISSLQGASGNEVKSVAAMIDLMLSIIPKGEESRYFQFAMDKLKDKAGIKQ